MNKLIEHLSGEMQKLRQAGTYKEELVLQSPQDARVKVGGREVVMLTSNNYLGFANHPRVREAQKKAIDRWGAGMASVRFICGTETLHRELETEIAAFFGTDDAILYMTCWNANEGLFAAILDEGDGLGGRRLHDRPEGPDRDPPAAQPALPLLQFPSAGGRRGLARGLPHAARRPLARPPAARERGVLPQRDHDVRLPDPARHAPDRPGHRRRHGESNRDGQSASRGGRLRLWFRIPRRPEGSGAPALPGARGPREARPRPRRGRLP